MIANTHTNTNNGVLQNIRSTSSRAKNEFVNSKHNYSRKHTRQRIQANNRRPMWRILRIFVERSDRPPTVPPPPRHLHEHLNNKPPKIVLAPDLSTPYLNNMHNNTVTTIYIKYLRDTLSTHKRLHSWFFSWERCGLQTTLIYIQAKNLNVFSFDTVKTAAARAKRVLTLMSTNRTMSNPSPPEKDTPRIPSNPRPYGSHPTHTAYGSHKLLQSHKFIEHL